MNEHTAENDAPSVPGHEFNWQTGYCACGWPGPAIDEVPEAHAAHIAAYVIPPEQSACPTCGPTITEPHPRRFGVCGCVLPWHRLDPIQCPGHGYWYALTRYTDPDAGTSWLGWARIPEVDA